MDSDVIVVGGGSAGAVLASRLSEDPARRVILIEAGPDMVDGHEPWDIRDSYYSAFFHPKNFWPDLHVSFGADGRSGRLRTYEQARVLGGGSSVNAMIALRGLPDDFAEWAALGLAGWSWPDVLPYFRKLERDTDFDDELHGRDGSIPIRRVPQAQWPGLCQSVAQALARQGWPFVADMNGVVANGYCAVPMNNTPTRRVSTAIAYLGPKVRARSNLRIMSGSFVEGIRMSGRRATGVRLAQGSGVIELAAREVVVAAGALHSPALLQRAGIGPGAVLQSAGVPVVHDSPGVGRNLQDHPTVSVACYLAAAGRQAAAARAAANLALRYDSGIADCAPSDMYVSVTNKASWHPFGRCLASMVICVYKPYSRGVVEIDRPEPRAEPRVAFNLLSDVRDLMRLAAGVRLTHAIYASPEVSPLAKDVFLASFSERMRKLNRQTRLNWWVSAAARLIAAGPAPLRRHFLRRVVSPGDDIGEILSSDTRLNAWIRERAVPFYHAVGTCRMGGNSDPLAVLDAHGRVRGVEGLRVIDASAMPIIPRANTNLTTIMMAEKLSAEFYAG